MILVQPISGEVLVRKLSKSLRMGKRGYDAFERNYREIWGFRIEDSSPQLDAAHVKVPTFVIQVRKDSATYAEEDVQAVYDNIPVEDKNSTGSRAQPSASAATNISPSTPSKWWSGTTPTNPWHIARFQAPLWGPDFVSACMLLLGLVLSGQIQSRGSLPCR